MRKASIVLLGVLLVCAVGTAQDTPLELELSVGGSVPFLPTLENGQEIYQIGPTVQGSGFFPLNPSVGLYFASRLGYLSSATYADKPFNLISLAPGLHIRRQLDRLVLGASLFAGAYVGMFEGESGADLMVEGGPSIRYLLSPALTIGLSADYTHCFADSFRRSMYSGIRISLGSTYSLAGRDAALIEYEGIRFEPVFPVFHAYYDDHPLGSISIANPGAADLRDLRISFFTPDLMDRPKECLKLEVLAAGAETEAPLYGLFNRNILGSTEGTKVQGEITISYSYLGETQTVTVREAVNIKNRNAMSWDDDRKAASFITARDEDILRFAKSTASFVRDSRSRIVNRTFRIAMGMFRALERYGLRYVIDPATPYSTFSADATAVDYLQFPAQTLSFGGGDCDDLSILYSALLEAVGIETAFITVPGHIYLAFNPQIPPEEAENVFVNIDDVIIQNETCWVPVEVTMLNESFLSAWREGARKWRQHSPAGSASLLPVRSAWQTYEPVDRPPLNARVQSFDPAVMRNAYEEDLEQMTSFQIQDRIYELQDRIARGGAEQRVFVNKLGVLYARYGLLDKAKREFGRLSGREYFFALINLGNIHYLEGDYRQALQLYQKALELRIGSSLARLGVARSQYELENYRAAELAYQKAKESDPSAAARFSYLSSTGSDTRTRAADSEAREERMLWGY
jgi:tetratricopeptide (TPR) repeat protein